MQIFPTQIWTILHLKNYLKENHWSDWSEIFCAWSLHSFVSIHKFSCSYHISFIQKQLRTTILFFGTLFWILSYTCTCAGAHLKHLPRAMVNTREFSDWWNLRTSLGMDQKPHVALRVLGGPWGPLRRELWRYRVSSPGHNRHHGGRRNT